jgi:hypothetical protein
VRWVGEERGSLAQIIYMYEEMLKFFINYFIFGNIRLCCEEKVKHLIIGSFSKWESLKLPSINLFSKLVLNLSLVVHVIVTNNLP